MVWTFGELLSTNSWKRLNFKTVQLKITRSDFDEIWQKFSEYSRIEFVCFSFHVGLLVITLSSLKLHTENNACVDVFISTCTAWSAAARSPVGCSELFQLHQQPILYKLPSVVTFTFIQTFDQDFVFFTKWCHGLQRMWHVIFVTSGDAT